MLRVDVEKALGDFRLGVAFQSARATGLFGPSGAGKTTVANMIAGLLKPDRGRISIGDEVLFDSTARIDVPAHRRRIGYVFQEGRLFPHLSVGHNLDYGRRVSHHAYDADAERRVIDMLDVGHLLARRPGHLSGGERQRIAIGRALLSQPRLLILDEPLAALDGKRKDDILPYLERLRDADLPLLYVSHHAHEVRRIAQDVVRIDDGRVVETGGLALLDAV